MDVFFEASKGMAKDIDNAIIEDLCECVAPPPFNELMEKYNLYAERMKAIEKLAEHQYCCPLCEFHMSFERQMDLHCEHCDLALKAQELAWKLNSRHHQNVRVNFASPFNPKNW